MSVEFWAGFFQAAGLEPEVSASYANIFFLNKIQPNHLPDIDRDALKEMGISPMGDILTILKYIKISCPLVTSSTAPGNEQLLLYQFTNIQDSKSGCCGQNQFECVTQASGDIPPATIIESPLNLTVYGNSSTNKITTGNECCNSEDLEMPDYETRLNYLCSSINSTVSCDKSEATNNTYTISPNKLEMDRCADDFKNNLEQTMNVSYVDISEQQSVEKEKIIIPGGDTPHQKWSVFDRLGHRSNVEKIWVKTSYKQFNQNQHFNNKRRQKCTPQRDNGIMRSNHLRNKWHCSPIDDDRVNNMESVNTITMDISQSLTSRIQLSAPRDEKKSQSAADNVELSRETVTVGPDAIFITQTPPCFSSSPQNEDPELEVLRDPTRTQHTEQYYLAWADRRKQALSFPGFKPSFLQES